MWNTKEFLAVWSDVIEEAVLGADKISETNETKKYKGHEEDTYSRQV